MANRKSASQKTTGGGASRSANLKPANKNISSNQPSAPKAQTHTSPKPQQPPPAANRPTNGTKPQGTRNGPPKSQGSAGASWFFGGAEATSGHKTSQDRSMSQAAPKHTGNGSNNLQKAQGQLLHTANLSSKPKTPKPKHPHPLTGGHSPAQNPVLSSPPRPGNVQPSPFSGVHGNKVGQNVFQDQTLTSKQSGHPRPHAQKAQNHAATPQIFPTHQQPTNSGKNTTNGKVQTTTQHAPPGGQSNKGSENPSHNHKVREQSRHVLETSPASKEGVNNNGGWSKPLVLPKIESTPTNKKESHHGRETSPMSNKDKGNNNVSSTNQVLGRGEPPIPSKKDSHHANNNARAHFRHETLSPTSNKGDSSKLSSLAEDRSRGRGEPFPSPPKKDPTPASNKAQEAFSASTKGNNHKVPSKPCADDGRGEPSPLKRMPLPHAVKSSLSILAEAPQLPSVYAGSKGTGNRPSDSTNMKTSGSKHNSSNGSHHESSSSSAKNMSTRSPALPEGSGAFSQLLSWFTSPASDISKEVQATKKPPPSPNKAKGLENLPNGSQTHQIRVSDSSKSKGTGNAVIIPLKDRPSPNDKAHPQSLHAHETSLASRKGNGNNVSSKPRVEDRSLGCNVKSAMDCSSSPKSSDKSKHLPSHSSTSDGSSPIVAQKQQFVPSARGILTPQLPLTQSSPHSQAAKNKQGVMGASQKPQAVTVPPSSLGGLMNNISSFFRWTKSAPPIDRQVQATNEPRQAGDSSPKPLASTHQAPKSSKGDGSSSKSHHAQILSLTSPGHKRTELSEKEVVLSTERVKNGPHDARDVSDKTNTSSGKMKAGEMATKLTFISSHATGSAEKSNERQSVRGSSTEATKSTVRRKKEFKVRSSSNNVLSQPPRKTSILRKGLLRQYSPTLVWQKSDSHKVMSAYSTLTAAPLPSPPRNELQNTVARRTIARNPDMFKHTTPIKVDALEKNLKDHPNQPFVQSVVRSLRNGFWSWADTANHPLPTTHDGSHQRQPSTSKVKTDFIRQQRDEEVELERWSKPFGKKLLPGMHASPITAVPKSTPGKYRLIIDQSRGPHALNSTIPKSQVKVKLDTIHDLGTTLIPVRKKHPNRKIVLFKSDVKSAYRLLPMHPLWQIKQAVSVDGQFHIDRCNTFGNRGGGWNWDSVISLVNWIGTEKKKITDLLGYVDDNFGWEFAGNMKYYKPYKKYMPAKQTRLLQLWDELGIPHDENKQLSGPSLPILGYEVDANAMTVKVPDEKKAKIIQSLRNYAHEGTSYTLRELQSVAGSTSAVLNLYPQLRPGLRGLFDEMAGKEEPSTKLMVTKPVARSLSKLADYLERAQPVQIQQKK